MKICLVEGCQNKVCAKGLCNKHYKQNKKFGYIPKRSMTDLNEIIEYDTYAEIILYNRQCEEIGRALIDLDDINKCKNIKWHISKNYVCNTQVGSLHRFITNCTDDMVVDHINHNKLDNRKSNLRICTIYQNSMNLKTESYNKCNFRGISIEENRSKKYRVRLQVNHKTISKYFYTMTDAIRYKIAIDIFYHKEYSSLYSLLEQIINDSLEYSLYDFLNANSLEQIQEYTNNLFTDNLLFELYLLE